MSTSQKPGIIATIKKFIADHEGKPFTHEDIHAELIRKFPNREPSGMMATIKTWAVPGEMKKLGYLLVKQGKQYTAHPMEGLPNGKKFAEGPQAPEKIKKDAPPSPIRLFRYTQDKAEELFGRSASIEREVHDLIEKHMECFLGIRLVAHEYSTGTKHGGRIDSLGLDKNNYPVIIEYKRHSNENVVSQTIDYFGWLIDHKGDFYVAVLQRLGQDVANAINWNSIRLLCIAEDFTRHDKSIASLYKDKNIELIRYKYFADDMLMLEWVIL